MKALDLQEKAEENTRQQEVHCGTHVWTDDPAWKVPTMPKKDEGENQSFSSQRKNLPLR